MVTANPLLIPELRVMLAEGDVEGLRGVAEELHPASVAEFSEGLEDGELWQLLDALPVAHQADIFPYYPLARQVDLVKRGSSRWWTTATTTGRPLCAAPRRPVDWRRCGRCWNPVD